MTYQYSPETIKEQYNPEYVDRSAYQVVGDDYPITVIGGDNFHIIERGSEVYIIDSEAADIRIRVSDWEDGDVFTMFFVTPLSFSWTGGTCYFPGGQSGDSGTTVPATNTYVKILVKDGAFHALSCSDGTSWS